MKPQENRSPSYLILNQHSFCFRIKVPKDLQCKVGKRELRYSLKTGTVKIAKQKSQFLAKRIQRLFNSLRKGGSQLNALSDDQIKKLVNQYIKDKIDNLDEFFNDDNDLKPYSSAEEFNSFVKSLKAIRDDAIVDLNVGNFSIVEDTTHNILVKNGINNVDKDSPEFRKLCVEIHKAYISLLPIEQKHLLCDFSYRDELPKIFPQVFNNTYKSNHQTIEQTSGTLSEIADEYWNRKKGRWTVAAIESYARYKKRLLEYFGEDKLINSINYKAMEQFRDKLKKTGSKGKPITDKTVNLHLEFYSGLFNHAIQSGRIKHNPVSGVKFSDKRNQ